MNLFSICAVTVMLGGETKICDVSLPEPGDGAVVETMELENAVAWRVKYSGAGEKTVENEEWVFDFGADLRCWPVSHAQGEYIPQKISTIGDMAPMPAFAPVAAGIGEMHNYAREMPGTAESPLVVEGDGWVAALGDAGVLDYARTRFAAGDKPGQVKTVLEGPAKFALPYTTPWRYIHYAKDAAELANTQGAVLDALCEKTRIADTSWIKPGKVLRVAKLDTKTSFAAVDFALRNNMQYIEFDCGWYGQEHTGDPLKPGLAPERIARGEEFDFFAALAYAKEKGIGVICYVNREPLKKNRDAILDALVAWGVAGVKYGFVNVGDQKWRKWTVEAIDAAAKRHLMVDIHDEFRLTGIERTYPNVLTVEGIRGNEEMPTAAHDCALPFTRYLDGPGDYTPCWTVSRIKNTLAHQLALPCVYTSGWQFLFWYQRPDQIDEKDPALDFWRELPCEFDETRVLEGSIGEYAVVARRKGNRWFVGGINANGKRRFSVPLDFAGGGAKKVRLFRDADADDARPCAKAACETLALAGGARLEVEAAANGGFAAIVDTAASRVTAFAAQGERALADRLVMYWNTHATDVFVNDEAVVGVGGGRAAVPTVAFDGNRSHPTAYKRPKIEDLPLRQEDPRGMFLEPAAGGPKEWAAYGKTGTMICSLNREIISLACTAAREGYEALAWNVLDTYLAGILARNLPTDLRNGHQRTLFGMQSMETIHDNTLTPICELYALLKPYIAANHPERKADYDAALKKWAEVQIANGVADNNWDMMQLNFILDVALVLDPDAAYADAKGREHYIDVVLNQSSVRNLSIRDLCAKGFDADTGIWWECPGYSLVTLKDIAKFTDRLRNEAGIDIEKEIPVLAKVYNAAREYLFPDGMTIGFGDTHPSPLPKEIVAKIRNPDSPLKPFFYAPNASWLISRTGMDPEDDIAFALNAALGNHMHANGISLELYARGYRIAPDAGIGWSLYSGDDYKEYYSRFPAHNTVMVNSRSDFAPMKCAHAFELVAHGDDWATVAYRESETGAEQMRTVAMVKREGVKYFVDCFRSRIPEDASGDGEWHDYYYHNFGDELVFDGECEATEEIAFVESGLYALSYITDKYARKGEGDLRAEFRWQRPEGERNTKFYMNWAPGRTFIKALAPATEGLSRVKSPNYNITKSSRTPVIVARQRDEAWERPFMAAIDPVGCIKDVEFTATGMRVSTIDGRTDDFCFAQSAKQKSLVENRK